MIVHKYKIINIFVFLKHMSKVSQLNKIKIKKGLWLYSANNKPYKYEQFDLECFTQCGIVEALSVNTINIKYAVKH